MAWPVNDPVVIGAIIGFIGIALGQVLAWRSKSREQDLASINAAVQTLRAEYDRLKGEVVELRQRLDNREALIVALRSEAEDERKRRRVLGEKYSVCIVWITGVQTKAHFEGWEVPDVPDLIVEDMPPKLPDPD